MAAGRLANRDTDGAPVRSGRGGWGRGASMPGYGADFKQSLIDELGPWSLSASGWGETLPHEDNRVTLDPELKDRWGIPAARIEVRELASHGRRH